MGTFLSPGQGQDRVRPAPSVPLETSSCLPTTSQSLLILPEDRQLYDTWQHLILGSSYTASKPLSSIPHLPARDPTGRTFRLRVTLVARVLLIAQHDFVAASESKGETQRSVEELAVTILITAYVLMEPYLVEGTPAHLQPFRAAVEGCIEAVSRCEVHHDLKLPHILSKALWGLLTDIGMTSSHSPIELLELPRTFQYVGRNLAQDVIENVPSPTLTTKEVMALLKTSAQRPLSLNESRKLSSSMEILSAPAESVVEQQITPEMFASIAACTPRIAIQLVKVLGQDKTPSTELSWEAAVYLQAAANQLTVNSSKSFDFIIKLLSVSFGSLSHSSGKEAKADGTTASASFMVYRYLLPTYLSRCFAALTQEETARRTEELPLSQRIEDEDDVVQGEEAYFRRSSLSESTSRGLDSLLGFLQGTGFLDLFPHQEARPHLHEDAEQTQIREKSRPHSAGASYTSSDRLSEEEYAELQETVGAVAVEMKAFALEMVRYRSAGELLKRLM